LSEGDPLSLSALPRSFAFPAPRDRSPLPLLASPELAGAGSFALLPLSLSPLAIPPLSLKLSPSPSLASPLRASGKLPLSRVYLPLSAPLIGQL